MKKVFGIAFLFSFVLLGQMAANAECYYNSNGTLVPINCPPNIVTTSYYSPYGTFTVSDEWYLPTVTYRTGGRRVVVQRPLPPPPPPKYSSGAFLAINIGGHRGINPPPPPKAGKNPPLPHHKGKNPPPPKRR